VARTGRRSVRLWQTELFFIVIVVAILVLSVSLSQGLQRTLGQLGEADQLSDASALASQLGPEYPLTVESLARIREHVDRFHEIYGDDVWVYDVDGSLRYSTDEEGPPQDVLEEAFVQGLADSPPYASMDLGSGGYVVAGKAVYDDEDRRAAVVVTVGSVEDSLAVLEAVRGRLWTTFWVALIVAGLLGFGFAEFIGRRVRQMSQAAAAIADGDFGQRLPTNLVPDEILELAQSYNRMAVTLGEAFSTLREREQEIATVIESLGEGVVAFDAQGMVRVANPPAVRLLGLEDDPDDLTGRHVDELTFEPAIVNLVQSGLDGSDVADTATLGDRTVLLHGTPIRDEDGTTEGVVLLMSDVTERQRLEEAQRQFVANASHEMRTPIAAVKGLLELLTDGADKDTETREDFLRTMSLEVDRLGRLVGDLLMLAELDAQGLDLRLEPIDIADLFEDIVTVMRPLSDASGVALLLDLPDEPVQAWCDRDRIMQVLVGFVDNALKHSSEGDAVTLATRRADGRITVEVSDEGAGIDPDVIPNLFDRFFRVDESRAGPKGAGLGLAIAREIVEAHGSSIHVESDLGAGATFAFDLPAGPASHSGKDR
jgi:PAS domain S-box-containing protein